MRSNTARVLRALLMLVLLTAQSMGWCRAYVCECSGMTEITAASHCHDGAGPHQRHDCHDTHSEPCGAACCKDDHDHEALAAPLLAITPAPRAPAAAQSGVVAVLQPPCAAFAANTARLWLARSRGPDPGGAVSCLSRRTVALLM